MAASEITRQKTSTSGSTLTFVSANVDGNFYSNDNRSILVVNNAGVGATIVTITTPALVEGLAVADIATSIPAGESKIFGPHSTELVGPTVNVSYSVVTSVTVALVTVN